MIKKKAYLPPPLKAWYPTTIQFFLYPNQNWGGDFHDGIKSSCRKCFVVFLIMGYYNFAFHLGDKFDMIVCKIA